jgi:hypothetical protein
MPENKIDTDKLKAECSPDLDEFYSHADPLVKEVRAMVCKIINSNGGAD